MSALGHEPTSRNARIMSVLPLKADIHKRGLHVRLVPLVAIFWLVVSDHGKTQNALPHHQSTDLWRHDHGSIRGSIFRLRFPPTVELAGASSAAASAAR